TLAHGEGCYFADASTLQELNRNRQVILRYADKDGQIVPEANPNGSIENIAGICNRERNVFGLMPHPDRASDQRLGSADGAKIFRSMMQTIAAQPAYASLRRGGRARAAQALHTTRSTSVRWFVTGTDTGVGTTHTIVQPL